MHQNAAKNTAIMQHNASTRHTRFASLRYQTCIKNASKCSKKYSNNAAQCEPPTYPLCLPTLSKMHQNAARHPAQNTAGAQHNANPRQPRFASLRYQKYIKNWSKIIKISISAPSYPCRALTSDKGQMTRSSSLKKTAITQHAPLLAGVRTSATWPANQLPTSPI